MRIELEQIDSELTPLGTVTLHRYAAETGERGYEIRIDDNFLMATHGAHGEVVMPALARELLPHRSAAGLTVLIGGLGAGHTLAATLALPGVTAVQVVEISAQVVAWNRRYFDHGKALDDSRVSVIIGDLLAVLQRLAEPVDLLLLDVDNGPGWLASEANETLYQPAGVLLCRQALASPGVLAVWSPAQNPAFRATLSTLFGRVEERSTAELSETPGTIGDVVYLATS